MARTALMAAACAAIAAAQTVSITSESSWFLDSSIADQPQAWMSLEPTPISLALKDLATDWYKVIGVPPVTVAKMPATSYNGGPVVVFSLDASLGREAFTVVASNNSYVATINVTGGDTRGLIYGIYHVSQDILGVDPFWYFSDIQPQFAGVIDVPATYAYSSGVPAFYSRGSFNNDEDLSGYFHTDVVGDSVFSAEFANRLCELLLRLRANTIIPSTFAFVDERHYRVAAARGLILGNHHVMPVGNNVYAWPKGVPYAYRTNPKAFQLAWRTVMEYEQADSGREMVYSLGYRGVNDEPFWNQDPACDTVQCRGQTISEAIANQSQLAQSLPYAVQPRMVSYMWMELLALREAGTLVLPPNVSCVWTDFPGAFNILGEVNASKNDGFYAHIQMMSGVAAQLTEFIPPRRIFSNIWNFFAKLATAYGMINTSDSKYVPITFEAVYRYMYSPNAFNASATCSGSTAMEPHARSAGRRKGRRGPVGWWPMPRAGENGCTAADFGAVTPQQAQDAFLLEFATRHFATPANATALPAAIADIWGRYFNISYMAIDGGNNYGDHYLGTTIRSLIGPFETAVDSGARPDSLANTAAGVASFAAANLPFVSDLYARVEAVAPFVAPGVASSFFAAHPRAQVAIHYYHLVAFQATAAAAYAYLDNDTGATVANLTAAVAAMDSLMTALREGEGAGVWRGSYRADGWTWCWGTRVQLVHLLAHVQGQHVAEAPNNPYPDYAFMTYECPPNTATGCPAFPLSAARWNVSTSWDIMPRVTCSGDMPGGQASPGCTTSFSGISFTGPQTLVGMFTAAVPQRASAPVVIRYTVDGTEPNGASTLYTAPFAVTQNTTVTAQAFDAASNEALLAPNVVQVLQTPAA